MLAIYSSCDWLSFDIIIYLTIQKYLYPGKDPTYGIVEDLPWYYTILCDQTISHDPT